MKYLVSSLVLMGLMLQVVSNAHAQTKEFFSGAVIAARYRISTPNGFGERVATWVSPTAVTGY
jgi:hypothetical protein